MRKGIRIGSLLGIEIALDYSWFFIFFWITWSLTEQYLRVNEGWSPTFRLGLAITTALLFFSSILAHEFGHSLVAQATGVPVKRITLFIFGGLAQIAREPHRARDEFFIALAGPLVSLLLAAGFGTLGITGRLLALPSLTALGGWLVGINLSLALFNLLPGFPLDGGRVLRAIVWGLTGDLRGATRIGALSGQVFAWIFILVGIWQITAGDWTNGLWLAFIGWFLYTAATRSSRRVAWQDRLQGYSAREVLRTDCPQVAPSLTLSELVDNVIFPSRQRCFPVMEADHFLGLVTVELVKQVPKKNWRTTTVAQVMLPVAKLVTSGPDEALSEILDRMTSEAVNQLPVIAEEQLVGMVARDNILNFIRLQSDLAVSRTSGG